MTCWGNQLYIVDSGRHKVYLTDLKGNIRKSVGKEKSTNAGDFIRPTSICVDSVGNFIVADSQRLQARVEKSLIKVIYEGHLLFVINYES